TERLLALNREFYATFAHPFAASRPVSDPGLRCVLSHIPRRARVLDVGCGNGRLALLLDRERPGATYLGLDAVPEVIEVARAQAEPLTSISAEFRVADVARPGWSDALLGTTFDCAALLAVLHHIPGFDLRARVLCDLAGLLEPGGRLILSTWQFLGSRRLRRKIVDWMEVGIAEEKLEPGDYLLDWKREGRGLRYCHLVDEAEVERLAAESGFYVQKTFRAGGREGNLSLFAVLDKKRLP
ncbi:MAG TPA: class I SAM-dependent methyltransferase, partial [Chromatiaceae bacterium]|nr:class I SAM-dependent methyltransferase [Chromatiaceae bacterium]